MSELTSYYYYEDRVITPATHQYRVYHADDVDKVIAENDEEIYNIKYSRDEWAKACNQKDKEITELQKTNSQLASSCVMLNKLLDTREEEVKTLKQKLEDVNELVKESKELLKESQKMHQRCADNASKQIRRLKRALWMARAKRARSSALSYHLIESHPDKDVAATYKRKANKWEKAKDKCLKKAEEFK